MDGQVRKEDIIEKAHLPKFLRAEPGLLEAGYRQDN